MRIFSAARDLAQFSRPPHINPRPSRNTHAPTMAFPMPPIVAPAQTATLPRCPVAQVGLDHEVRTYAGAGGERRTYICTCGMTWNQKRLDKLASGEDPDVRTSNRVALGGSKRTGREYKCGNCGEPKKGHICTHVKKKARTEGPPSPAPPLPEAVAAAPAPLAREQYADMLEFSTPATDAEILAFLRKYDLKPSEATELYKDMMCYQAHPVAAGALADEAAVVVKAVAVDDDALFSTPEEIVAVIGEIVGLSEDTDVDDVVGVPPGDAEKELSLDELLHLGPHTECKDTQAGIACAADDIVGASEDETEDELSIDELLNLDKCADCQDVILGDDRKTCHCGTTVVHRSCFKLCAHCA